MSTATKRSIGEICLQCLASSSACFGFTGRRFQSASPFSLDLELQFHLLSIDCHLRTLQNCTIKCTIFYLSWSLLTLKIAEDNLLCLCSSDSSWCGFEKCAACTWNKILAQVLHVILGKADNPGCFSIESEGGNAFSKSSFALCHVSLGQGKSSFLVALFLLLPLACSSLFVCRRS